MRPSFNTRFTHAGAALGVLGATCALIFHPTAASGAPRPHRAGPGYSYHAFSAASLAHRGAGSGIFGRRVHRRPSQHAKTAAAVQRMVAAGDHIAKLPYVWGGGHGSFDASGYDCSGSVSYVLHAGGVLGTPQASAGLASFGEPGPGHHVTIYANGGHVWMTVDGRRFDTIAFKATGTRWSSEISSSSGYTIRHPKGF